MQDSQTDLQNKRRLVFCGDIHGEFTRLIHNLQNQKITNADVIVCGDIGLGFRSVDAALDEALKGKFKRLPPAKGSTCYYKIDDSAPNKFKWLQESGNTIYCIRGNHDDPSRFNGSALYAGCPIRTVKDYTILNLDSAYVLCIGGGFSIDYLSREVGRSFWVDEMPVCKKKMLDSAFNKRPINDKNFYVATHAAPKCCKPNDKLTDKTGYWFKNPEVIKGCESERRRMDSIKNCINKKLNACWDSFNANELPLNPTDIKWFYGHYHMSGDWNRRGIFNFKPLNIHELYEIG